MAIAEEALRVDARSAPTHHPRVAALRLARLAARLAFIVALPLFLVTANIRWLAGDVAFYERGFREYDADQTTGIALAELDRAARQIVAYFENDAGDLRIIVSEDNREASLFNEEETAHMRDVKTLMRGLFRLNEIALAVVIAYVAGVVLWARERSLRGLAWDALSGVALGFLVVSAVGALALTGFDEAWTRFHEIAFTNDFWQLDPDTDHLIQMFPEPFWEEATLFVAVLTLAEVFLVVMLCAVYLLVSRRRVPAPGGTPAAVAEPGQ